MRNDIKIIVNDNNELQNRTRYCGRTYYYNVKSHYRELQYTHRRKDLT